MTSNGSLEASIEKARAGDREAFEGLVLIFQPRLQALLQVRIGARLRASLDPADALQETLARAFRSMGTFRFQGKDSFFRWLAGIAERVILEARRRDERGGALELLGDPPARDPSPSTTLRREELFDRLKRALDGLRPEYREVILLARIEGLALKEIAARMDRSLDAVKQLLSRALKKLKQSFGDTESVRLPDRSLGSEQKGDEDGAR